MKYPSLALCLPIALACLAGCSSPRIDLAVASQPNVNPDISNRPSPVIVKTFELRSELNFKQNDFQSLFERPVQTLGADLVAADEMVLVPGEARKVAYHPNAETRFLGVVAGFRYLERAQWRVIKPIDAEEENYIALEFNDVSILTIADEEAKNWEPEEAVKNFQQHYPQQDVQQPSPVQPEYGEVLQNVGESAVDKAFSDMPTEKKLILGAADATSAIQESSPAPPPVRSMSQIK
jgi:type VI secretion system protein VasD